MKKIILLLSLLFVAINSYGYSSYDDIDIEAYTKISTVVSIIFAVFSIIFYIKIWNMTNDVKRIKELLENKFPDKKDNPDKKDENPEGDIPPVDLLKEGELIISYKGETMICNQNDLKNLEGEYKIIYKK